MEVISSWKSISLIYEKKVLLNDGQQFHQYQQNKPSPLAQLIENIFIPYPRTVIIHGSCGNMLIICLNVDIS